MTPNPELVWGLRKREVAMTSVENMDIQSLIQKLADAAAKVDKNDLLIFAEMHGWCEQLFGAVGPDGEQACPNLAAHTKTLAGAVESLIMSSADDPDAALLTIQQATAALANGDVAEAASTADAGSPAVDDSPVSKLIQNISAKVPDIEADDLANLAKLHGWCEALVAETGPEGNAPNPSIVEGATAVTALLEGLIIGTSEDGAADLKKIGEFVSAMAESATSMPAVAPARPDGAMCDAEVGARLDEVFEGGVKPVPAETSALAPAAESAAASAEAEPSFVSEPLLIDPKELEFVTAFIEEAGEHLEGIESALLEVEQAPNDTDKINELFRPFHTIKGMAGFLNLRDVNCLTHEVETLLDQGRRGDREMTAGIIDLVFEVIDILKVQIAAIGTYSQDPNGDPVPQPPVSAMIDRLRGVIAGRIQAEGGTRSGADKESAPSATPAAETAVDESSPAPASKAPAAKTTAAKAPTTKAPTTPPPAATASPQAAKVVVGDQSVRIDTKKLDALVDMVGELVIAHSQIAASDKVVGDPKLSKDSGHVGKIVRDVQEVAMAMRMVPVKSTFQKMARLVRDLSRKAGKNVELFISGEETEVDKNVIQQIGDPLVHMVRNAVDHGIESADKRKAAGKSERGSVYLNAFHQSGNIVIQIRDDGNGLDPAVLIAKAIEKGVVSPDEELTDQQAFHLIFAPGFSTAAEITDISGRGVGMDVVKRNIEQLRGRVDIVSELGRGSTFSIRLPLTLAIIDGMVVRLGSERFIIPTTSIEQALRPQTSHISTVQNRGELLQVRGRLIPLVQLGQLFGLGSRVEPDDAMVVIVNTDGRQIGLVVEELIGQQQVVIKSLGEKLRGLKGISGAAILGDGRVGLILDAGGVRSANDQWRRTGTIVSLTAGECTAVGETQSVADEGVEATDHTTDSERQADSQEPVLA